MQGRLVWGLPVKFCLTHLSLQSLADLLPESISSLRELLAFTLTEVQSHKLSKTSVELFFSSFFFTDTQGLENGRPFSQNSQRPSETAGTLL